MKRLQLLSALLLTACRPFGLPVDLSPIRTSRGNGADYQETQPDSTADQVDTAVLEALDRTIYTCGIETDPSYDWTRDSLGGRFEAKAVIWKDGKRIAEIPSGPGKLVGNSPDGHWFFDGHLFSAFTDNGATLVCTDGNLRFSLPGDESVRDILPVGDRLFIVSKKGDRNLLRINGNIMLAKTGASFSTLYEDSGHVYCSYVTELGGERMVYLVKDGSEFPFPSSGDRQLLDICVQEDRLFKLYALQEGGWLMEGGDSARMVEPWPPFKFRTGRLRHSEGSAPAILLAFRTPAGDIPLEMTAYLDDEIVRGDGFSEFSRFAKNWWGGVAPGGISGKTTIFKGAGFTDIDSVFFAGRSCSYASGSRFYVALTPADGSGAYVLADGKKIMQEKFCGYLTGVSVSPPS